ncbi:MAG: hypothetical protein ABIQ18_48510 [Umezawaea sp.]
MTSTTGTSLTTARTEHLVHVLAELVAAVRGHVPQLPHVEVRVADLPTSHRAAAHAHRYTLRTPHHTGDGGRQADDVDAYMLVIGVDVLAGGVPDVLGTVLHAAAHVVNDAAGTVDTSRGGRYHNRLFLAAAAEVGLDVEETARDGWAATSVPAAAAALYQPHLDALTGAITAYRPTARAAASTAAPSRWLTAVCSCTPARPIRTTRGGLATGPILCGLCRAPFLAAQHQPTPD